MLLIFFVPAFLGRKKSNKRKKKQTLDYTYKLRGRERERVLNPYRRVLRRSEFRERQTETETEIIEREGIALLYCALPESA
jgi:hypothetical protein